MAYTVCVTWIAKPGEEDAVASCLEQLVEPSRAEDGVLVYIPNRDPEDPTKFFIYEQYVDEAAYTAHTETEHFKRLGFGDAIPRLLERRRSLSTTLSGGEQQMVAIGRALVQNPSVMLLDEPTEGLSPLLVGVVRDVLLTLREGGETILLAEQNLDLALAVADRVYVLDHGTVVFDGDAAHLAENRALVQELMGV